MAAELRSFVRSYGTIVITDYQTGILDVVGRTRGGSERRIDIEHRQDGWWAASDSINQLSMDSSTDLEVFADVSCVASALLGHLTDETRPEVAAEAIGAPLSVTDEVAHLGQPLGQFRTPFGPLVVSDSSEGLVAINVAKTQAPVVFLLPPLADKLTWSGMLDQGLRVETSEDLMRLACALAVARKLKPPLDQGADLLATLQVV